MRPRPNGFRKVTAEILIAESMGETFLGFPDNITFDEARSIIKRRALLVCGGAWVTLDALMALNAGRIKKALSVGATGRRTFISTARNRDIAKRICRSRDEGIRSDKTISRHLRTLCELGFISFRDNASRNREFIPETGEVYGLNLMPMFNRVAEFKESLDTASLKDKASDYIHQSVQYLKGRLKGFKQVFPARLSRFLDGMWEIANTASKLRNYETKRDWLIGLQEAVIRLENHIKSGCFDIGVSSWQDMFVSPITNKIQSLLKEVEGIRDMEVVSATEASLEVSVGVTTDLFQAEKADDVKVARLETIAKCLRRMTAANVLPKGVLREGSDPATIVEEAVRRARGQLDLPADVTNSLQRRYNREGAAIILLLGAHDPNIKNRVGWVRSFVGKKFLSTVDLSASFMRMSRQLTGTNYAS